MKIAEIRKKSDKDLDKLAEKIRADLQELSREKYLSEEKNAYKSKNLRKDLARVLTVMNEEASDEKTEDKEKK